MIPATIRQNPTPDLAAEIKAIKTRNIDCVLLSNVQVRHNLEV